jgi:peptide/nickel transport system substrate-binding protein
MRLHGVRWIGTTLNINCLISLIWRSILVTTLIMTLFACQMPSLSQGETVLKVALPSFGPELLDPSMDAKSGLQYHGHMFDHLLGPNLSDNPEGQLGALDRWEVNSSATTYTLKLREGMKWHDGMDVTSKDIAFMMTYYSRDSAQCGGCDIIKEAVSEVEIVDSHTAKIHLNNPDVIFMNNFNSVDGDMPILPWHYFEKVGDNGFGEKPIGSGPWKFVVRSMGKSIEYKANQDYWDSERIPDFDRLRLIRVPDANKRVAMLRSGEVDIAMLRPAGEAFSMEVLQEKVEPLKRDGFTVNGPKYITSTVLRFFMSYDDSFYTSNMDFRKALALALNVPSILDSVYSPEVASLATGSPMFRPVDDGYDPSLPHYGYNPEAARSLLKESGYQGETVYLFSIAAYGLTEMIHLNGLIAEDWRKIGINVHIIPSEYQLVKVRYHSQPQVFDDVAPAPIFHGVDYQTMPSVLGLIKRYMGSDGVLAYHDPSKGDRIFEELSLISNPDVRKNRLQEINRMLFDEYWGIPIVWRHEVYGLSPKLTGWQPTDGTSSDLHFETVRLSPY